MKDSINELPAICASHWSDDNSFAFAYFVLRSGSGKVLSIPGLIPKAHPFGNLILLNASLPPRLMLRYVSAKAVPHREVRRPIFMLVFGCIVGIEFASQCFPNGVVFLLIFALSFDVLTSLAKLVPAIAANVDC
jgi:hypothetical protein